MKSLRGNRWLTLVILLLGFLMILIDTTIVNVSIPTIIKDLNASLSDIEWVISGYALTFAAFLITFGRLSDVYGRKKFFIFGLLVFIISSAFSGEAKNISTLIIARFFQGVGGAIISPATLSLISSNFKGRERATAFGIWGAMAGVAVALGPILGGYFTTYQTWRWIFRVNIPIGIIAAIAAWFFVNESKAETKQKLDLTGMATSAIGFFFLVYALIEGQTYGWLDPKKDFSIFNHVWSNPGISIIPICLEIGLIFITAFLAIEYFKSLKNDQPAINLEFFRFRTYRYGLIAIAIISLGEFSSLFTLPIYFQTIKGFSPIKSGFAVLPLALAVMIAAPISAKFVNKLGSKWIISTGIFLESIGIFSISFLKYNTGYWYLAIPLVILGAGIGFAISQNTQVILTEIPVENSGSASGVLNTIRQVGSALGIAIVGAVLASQMTVHLTDSINKIETLPVQTKQAIIDQAGSSTVQINPSQEAPAQAPIPDAIKNNPGALQAFENQQQQTAAQVTGAVQTSLTSAIGDSIRFSSIFMFLGVILSLFIPNIKHPHPESENPSPIH